MPLIQVYQCDKCESTITNPEDGYVVHGNIYAADASDEMGLVGNNFPDPTSFCGGTTYDYSDPYRTPTFSANEVKKSVFCKKCFLGILHIDDGRYGFK